MLRPLMGLDMFHAAVNTQDNTLGVAYNTPKQYKGAIRADYNPNSSISVLFADDGPAVVADTIGEVDLEITLVDLTQEDYAELFGHTISNGILIENPAIDISPDIAFGFRAKRKGGGYSYYWLLKGLFSKPQITHETKADKITYQNYTFMAKFVRRDYDGQLKLSTRTDAVGVDPTTISNWFNAVPSAALDTTPPTVTVSPVDAATGVAVTANVVWTFNEAIQASCINSGNFMVMKADGTAVAGTLSYNAAQTVVTFDPTSNLSSASDYIAIATKGVKDLAGNTLAAASVSNFTTA
jgi:phi13 family phage major tail protein